MGEWQERGGPDEAVAEAWCRAVIRAGQADPEVVEAAATSIPLWRRIEAEIGQRPVGPRWRHWSWNRRGQVPWPGVVVPVMVIIMVAALVLVLLAGRSNGSRRTGGVATAPAPPEAPGGPVIMERVSEMVVDAAPAPVSRRARRGAPAAPAAPLAKLAELAPYAPYHGFLPLTWTAEVVPVGTHLVRLDVAGAWLLSLGIPVEGRDRPDGRGGVPERVTAELLLGDDGVPRAVRIVDSQAGQ